MFIWPSATRRTLVYLPSCTCSHVVALRSKHSQNMFWPTDKRRRGENFQPRILIQNSPLVLFWIYKTSSVAASDRQARTHKVVSTSISAFFLSWNSVFKFRIKLIEHKVKSLNLSFYFQLHYLLDKTWCENAGSISSYLFYIYWKTIHIWFFKSLFCCV